MKPSTTSEISALRSAIQKKKQVGLDAVKRKAERQKAAKASEKEEKKKKAKSDKERWEIQILKQELRDANLENAMHMDFSTLEYPSLYNTREEIMEILRMDSMETMDYEGTLGLLKQLDRIFKDRLVEDYYLRSDEFFGNLVYIWYEDPESGDPFDAVYGILYDGYIPRYCDESQSNFFVRISGKGVILEESVDGDWLELNKRHDAQGYVTIYEKHSS